MIFLFEELPRSITLHFLPINPISNDIVLDSPRNNFIGYFIIFSNLCVLATFSINVCLMDYYIQKLF